MVAGRDARCADETDDRAARVAQRRVRRVLGRLERPTDRADLAKARVDHDIAYIQNFSFWLDLRIILQTIREEFVGGTGH